MPRWFQVALTLALYAAMMGVAWWVLHLGVKPANDWVASYIGINGLLVLFAALLAAGVLYLWRDSARRRRAGRPDR